MSRKILKTEIIHQMEDFVMLYWILGLIAFGSVLLPNMITPLFTRQKQKITVRLFMASIVYGLVWVFLNWKSAAGFYAPTPYLGTVFFGFVINAIINWGADNDNEVAVRIILAAMLPIIMLSVSIFGGSDMWGNAPDKAKLIGDVKITKDLNKAMNVADTAHICLVDEEMARVAAQNALSKFRVADGAVPGSRYKIGKPTKQFIDGELWWIFPVEFQGWLKWRKDKQVPGYLRVSAQNPYAEGEAVQFNKQGEEIHLKYLNSACWEYVAERHLRYDGYMYEYLLDWTFEPDDNWNPFYTVTVAERTFGYGGLKITGIITLDLQTGEHEFYEIDKDPMPEWIDRTVPLEIIDYNIKKWGKYRLEGWWYNFWHNDKAQKPTKGWYLTYDPKFGAQWFSGFTSMSDQDQALTGFTLTNARTMQTVFCEVNGVTEDKAYDTARSLWSNYDGYKPSYDMVPYNIDGILTYVIPMKYEGQFKGVSLVALQNVNINGMGADLNEALSNYRRNRIKAASNQIAPAGGSLKFVKIKGVIDRIGGPVVEGKNTFFPFTIKGVLKRFHVPDSLETAEAVFMKPGDEVTITYIQTGEPIITCETFDLSSIMFSDENPAQARLIKNQQQVEKETGRIRKIDERQRLLKSDRLKEVDPEKLQQFLESQQQP
jgi:hypothetical protein